MAVAPADLLAPRGFIEPALFTEEGAALEAVIQEYINDGHKRATAALQGFTDPDPVKHLARVDETVTAWAYHRAFRAAFIRLNALPTTRSYEDQGSTNYMISQLRDLRDESDRWLGIFRQFTTATGRVEVGTRSLRHDFTW